MGAEVVGAEVEIGGAVVGAELGLAVGAGVEFGAQLVQLPSPSEQWWVLAQLQRCPAPPPICSQIPNSVESQRCVPSLQACADGAVDGAEVAGAEVVGTGVAGAVVAGTVVVGAVVVGAVVVVCARVVGGGCVGDNSKAHNRCLVAPPAVVPAHVVAAAAKLSRVIRHLYMPLTSGPSTHGTACSLPELPGVKHGAPMYALDVAASGLELTRFRIAP